MSDDLMLGPAMLVLTLKQRRFVMAMASDPLGTQASWARAAGYSDLDNAARIRACEAMNNPRIQAAVTEVARATLGTQGPFIAVNALLAMARNGEHPRHDRAVEMILNRTGMAEKQQIEVIHRDLTGDALMERIAALAAKHGVDLGRLGVSRESEPKVIEHRKDEGL